jgi:hypothetical protein
MTSTTASAKTVVGIFDDMASAESAVRELESTGISRDEVSIVANKNVENTAATQYGDTTADTSATAGASHVAADAGIGAALGGVGGLLLSFVALAIPGVGPILAVGPIVAALGGAGIGAVAGGVIGALTESGVPEEEAHYYAEGVRRGQVLVTVHTDQSHADQVQQVLDRNGAVDVQGRVAEWKQRGWTGHNPGEEPLSADELRREREYYSAAQKQGEEWEREEREQRPTGSTMEGGTLTGTRWPHEEAQPIGRSLAGAEASNAAKSAEETGRPIESDVDSPSGYRVTDDRSTVERAEQGIERTKDKVVDSARRLGSKVYDR